VDLFLEETVKMGTLEEVLQTKTFKNSFII